ncbi:GNAT family N-acetyltransferase [Cupriavidus basilensis]|uniref:GNAT family N-acetyltransferase n=1 Tax=Cupriavidus basilensis TaxID=68895 RepID=UPI0039F6B454
MTIRPLDWARDGAGILKLDTTYETDRIYAVKSGPLGIWLVEQVLGQPVLNHYDPSGFEQDCAKADHALVFESASGGIGGFAAVRLEAWNRSALLSAIFVAPAFRGTGIGRVLLGEINRLLLATPARCLRAETQNTNYPAIGFYRALGFSLCGLDWDLYDPDTAGTETALIFTRPVVRKSG